MSARSKHVRAPTVHHRQTGEPTAAVLGPIRSHMNGREHLLSSSSQDVAQNVPRGD